MGTRSSGSASTSSREILSCILVNPASTAMRSTKPASDEELSTTSTNLVSQKNTDPQGKKPSRVSVVVPMIPNLSRQKRDQQRFPDSLSTQGSKRLHRRATSNKSSNCDSHHETDKDQVQIFHRDRASEPIELDEYGEPPDPMENWTAECFNILNSLRPPDPSSTIPPKRPPPLSHESWQQERDQVRKSNREHGGVHPIKHKELSKVQLDFLACLEQFENMLETSAQICYAYSTLCRTKDWLLIAPTIVDQDTPPQCKVMFTRPFPVDIITQELSSMPDSHLRLDVGLFWGDGEQEEGEGKTCIQHRKYVLREVCRGLLPQLKLEAASPRRTWKEPPHLQCTPSLLRLRPHCGAGGFYDYYPPFSWPWLPPRVGRYFAATSHVGDGSKRFFPRLNFVCTPAGFVSRAHQDEPLSTQVRQWVGYKLWWWFPATPHNQAAWANGMCDTREIDWCIKNLTDLRVVLLGPFEETMIPVGAYHAVFALTPSIHSTMEFLCSTELVQTLTLRQRQIERLAPLVDKMDEAVDDEPAPSYQLARGELRELVEDVPERFFKPFERLFPDDFSNGMQIFEEREEAREYQMGN